MKENIKKELLYIRLFHPGKVLWKTLFDLMKPKTEQLYVVFGEERARVVLPKGLKDDVEGEGIDGGVHSSIAFGI